MNFTLSALSHLFLQQAPSLRGYIASRFPCLSWDRVEDAAADTFVEICRRPDYFLEVWQRGGEEELLRLLRVIAWRQARAQIRKSSYNHEVFHEALVNRAPQQPGQESMVMLRCTLPGALKDACQQVCPSRSEALQSAVMDRLLSGDPDTVVAKRHNIRREYLNKARRQVRERMLAA